MSRYKGLAQFPTGLLLAFSALSPQWMNAGIISDIVDYQLVVGPFPVQYLYDDTLPNPEIGQVQGGGPIVAVPNAAGINAPRWVAFVQPGFDFDPNVNDTSHISDIVAMVPTAQNTLQLRFWSDDPTVTAGQFQAMFGLNANNLTGTVAEDGLAHDVNGMLFAGAGASPFQHIIVASDTLNAGILPGTPAVGGPGSIPISETLAFRGLFGRILNQGMHGAAFYNAPGSSESDLSVFTAVVNGGGLMNTAIEFTEGAFGDPADRSAEPITDILAMRVVGNTITFGEWSEDPNQTSMDFLTAFFGGAIPNVLGPFDETAPAGSHPPLSDLLNLTGRVVTVNGQVDTLTEIDFKSDPPVPEPSTWCLFVGGMGLVALLKTRLGRGSRRFRRGL